MAGCSILAYNNPAGVFHLKETFYPAGQYHSNIPVQNAGLEYQNRGNEKSRVLRMKKEMKVITMKKRTGFILAAFIVLMFVVGIASAGSVGNTVHVVQKVESDGWSIAPCGASGIFRISLDRTQFTFTAKNLTPITRYALISYKEPYPGVGSKLLNGVVASDRVGSISISGSFSDDNLVFNTYALGVEGDYQNVTSAKIWLVPERDLVLARPSSAEFKAWGVELRRLSV